MNHYFSLNKILRENFIEEARAFHENQTSEVARNLRNNCNCGCDHVALYIRRRTDICVAQRLKKKLKN